MVNSYQIDKFYLVQKQISSDHKKPAQLPAINHIAVIDCSGSMSMELPKIREQLKLRIPKLIGEKDTLSIIWFSGRGEHGILLENEPIATLKDLNEINKAIDHWLKPVCLTGFKEPLEDVVKLVEKIKKTSTGVFSLFFMSDGHDNQWQRNEILNAVKQTAANLSSATFVEYGYYADRRLLTEMAEQAGGTLIFADSFDKYAPQFESNLTQELSGSPKIEIEIEGDPTGGFVFSLDGGVISTYSIDGNKVNIPEDSSFIYYLNPTMIGKEESSISIIAKQACTKKVIASHQHQVISAVYAAISLYSTRMKSSVVYSLLKSVGDSDFIDTFSGCFGKQKYSDFMEAAKEAAFSPDCRWIKGYDPDKIPADDVFTVFDLLRILASDENNKLLLDHESFKYNKIGRSRVDATSVLTDEEQAAVIELTDLIAKEKNIKVIKDLQAKIATITNKPEALQFKADPAPDGYPITNLVFNEERPNISVQVRKSGYVDLSDRLTDLVKDKIPVIFPTFIFRNYAIIKDGLINVDTLPCRLSANTINQIPSSLYTKADNDIYIISLKNISIINRNMIKEVSAKSLFELEYQLTKSRAEQKVYNHYRKELLKGKKSEGFAEKYGEEAASWLKEQGLTDYSGFSPRQVQTPASDFYMAKEMAISLKGLSSLPTIKDARDRMAKGKLTPSAALLVPTIKLVEGFLDSDIYKGSKDQQGLLETWITAQTEITIKETRKLIREKAQQLFTVIIGQVWPTEFSSLEENSLDLIMSGEKITGKIEMKEIKINI